VKTTGKPATVSTRCLTSRLPSHTPETSKLPFESVSTAAGAILASSISNEDAEGCFAIFDVDRLPLRLFQNII
jgi:hypothetical protein